MTIWSFLRTDPSDARADEANNARRTAEVARRKAAARRAAEELQLRREAPALRRAENVLHALQVQADKRSAFVDEQTMRVLVEDSLAFDARPITEAGARLTVRSATSEVPASRETDLPVSDAAEDRTVLEGEAGPRERTDLNPALDDLRSIREAMHADLGRAADVIESGSSHSVRQGGEGDACNIGPLDLAAGHAGSPAEDMPPLRMRLEARIAFVEAFHADTLTASGDKQRFEQALAATRTTLASLVDLQDALGRSSGDENAWLARLSESACNALAAGVSPSVVLAQIGSRLGGAPPSVASSGSKATSGLPASPTSGSDLPRETLQRAYALLQAGGEQAEIFKRLLDQQDLAEEQAADAAAALAQQSSAVPPGSGSHPAGDTLPLLTLRSV